MPRRVRAAWDGVVDAASSPINVIGLVAAAALMVVLVLVFIQFQTSDTLAEHLENTDRQAGQLDLVVEQNTEITCSIARLVAYVPSLQFEGEPLSNFVSWIEARKALLQEAENEFGCDPTVEAILRERVAKDQELLDEIAARP